MTRAIIILSMLIFACSNAVSPHPPPDYREDIAATGTTITDVYTATVFMEQFQYVSDGSYKFPTIEQCFDRGFRGDCKTSSVMAQWALGCAGKPSRIIILHHKGGSHAIVITNDNRIMISGHTFGYLDKGADWVAAACSFCGEYDYLMDRGKAMKP